MATLTNPVNKQNIVDRFADFVVGTANSGISWGTNALPFPEMPTTYFGGTTSGKPIGISGNSIGGTGITASNIRSVLESETYYYTNIRLLTARLNVTGDGGNTGSRPTAGIVFDQTAKAHLNGNYRSSIPTPNTANVVAGQVIRATNLETYFSNLRSSYNAVRDTAVTIQIDVCHASCHNSCHSSRGRR